MKRFLKNTLISVCVANFLALNFFMVLLVDSNSSFRFGMTLDGITSYLEIAGLFFTFGLLISIFFSIIIGWPLYWFFDKIKVKNYFSSSVVGSAIPIIPFGTLNYFGWNLPSFFSREGMITITVLGIIGAFGGISFCWLEINRSD